MPGPSRSSPGSDNSYPMVPLVPLLDMLGPGRVQFIVGSCALQEPSRRLVSSPQGCPSGDAPVNWARGWLGCFPSLVSGSQGRLLDPRQSEDWGQTNRCTEDAGGTGNPRGSSRQLDFHMSKCPVCPGGEPDGCQHTSAVLGDRVACGPCSVAGVTTVQRLSRRREAAIVRT